MHDHDSHDPGAYVILKGDQMLVTPRRLTALRAFHESHACRDRARGEWFSPKPGETAFDLLKKVKSPLTRQEIEVIATLARRTGRDIMTMVDTDEEERAAYRNGADRVCLPSRNAGTGPSPWWRGARPGNLERDTEIETMRIRSLLPGSAAAMAAAIATTGAATGTRAADMVVADEPEW